MDQYIGRLLDGRYEILEIIGTGGMAVVYKARCHRLNRLVAIKILKDEFARDEEFRRRFRAEGEAVAMLSHPNIVQVYDVSSSETANFIVMELIDGISLKQYMEKRGSLNWKETLHFAMQIAGGLEHAHSRGIVHRDIKPHNVMVLKNGSVKVMDFGIARVMSKSNTLTKEALGSVHYISPEQAKGSFTDNRSDLYSLSVVMYEMMTGRPPYDGESPVAVAIQHINGGAVAPSKLNPNIPRGMEQIIRKGMALEVNDRYASATEMLRDMEEFRKDPEIIFAYSEPRQPVRPAIPASGSARTTAQRVAMQRSAAKPQTERKNSPNRARRTQEDSHLTQTQRRRQAEKERRAQERSRGVTLGIILSSAGIALAIAIFLMALFNGNLLNQERDLVDVPYLLGQVYSDDLAYAHSGLIFELRPQEYDSQYPKGQIMRQEPSGGSRVAKGTAVKLTISLGPEPQEILMENLAGVTREEAVAFMSNQGFLPLVRNETSYVYEKGLVIRTDPAAYNTLTPGQTVILWVSTGPEMILEDMPDVMGLDKERALQVLDSLGFKNVRVEEVPSDKTPGTVIYQSVPKGDEIDVTTEILLEIVQPPEEATLPLETDPPQEEPVVKYLTFELEARADPYVVTVYTEGTLVMRPTTIEPGTTSYTLELRGTGTRKYDLYINDVLWDSKTVEFTADGD